MTSPPTFRRFSRVLPLLCMLAGPLGATAAPAAPRALVMCYEDVVQRPWSTPSGEGLNFELMRRVEKQVGEQFIYLPKPWRRCIEELRTGAVDAAIGAADAPERRLIGVYPTLPDGAIDPSRAVGHDYAHVFLRVGGNASWDGKRLVAPNNDVVVQSGYLVGNLLRGRGFNVREQAKSADEGLRMVAAGLVDVAVLQGLEASHLVRSDARFQGMVRQAPQPYAIFQLYLPFNKAVYARDPRRIEAIWRAVGAVRQSQEYRQLLREAGVPE